VVPPHTPKTFEKVFGQAFYKKLAGVGEAHGFDLRKTVPLLVSNSGKILI